MLAQMPAESGARLRGEDGGVTHIPPCRPTRLADLLADVVPDAKVPAISEEKEDIQPSCVLASEPGPIVFYAIYPGHV